MWHPAEACGRNIIAQQFAAQAVSALNVVSSQVSDSRAAEILS
jgi:hypothetical protein